MRWIKDCVEGVGQRRNKRKNKGPFLFFAIFGKENRKTETVPIILAIGIFCPIFAFSETITLKSGKTVEGKITERGDNYIKIDFQGVPLTYFSDQIDSVDGKKIEPSLAQASVIPVQETKIQYAEDENEYLCSEEAKKNSLEGSRLMQEGKINEAVISLQKAISIDSKCMAAYLGLGGCFSSLGEHKKAIEIYSEAVKIFPDKFRTTFYNSTAAECMFLNDYEKAISNCKASLENSPEDQQTYLFLGSAYYRLGENQKAKDSFQKSLDLSIRKGDNTTAKVAEAALKAIL